MIHKKEFAVVLMLSGHLFSLLKNSFLLIGIMLFIHHVKYAQNSAQMTRPSLKNKSRSTNTNSRANDSVMHGMLDVQIVSWKSTCHGYSPLYSKVISFISNHIILIQKCVPVTQFTFTSSKHPIK